MLNFALKGTYQDNTGYSWDYYRDDQLDPNPDPNAFYIIPKPQFVSDNNGHPSIGITTYQTSGADNGTGIFRFDVELSVPSDIEAQIASAIMANSTKFPGVTKPSFISLAVLPGTKASFDLLSDDTTTFTAVASNFGSNVASFLVSLTAIQLKTLKAALVNKGGAFDLKYFLTVPARLRGVTAVLHFDSSIAYQYQVTQPTYDGWGDETSPETVQTKLQESASSTVTLTWGESNPPKAMVDDVTNWANKTIADLVSAEVEKVIKLQGMQSDNSFNISEVSSFTNTYAENIVVNWQIAPTATLPSFPDMNLNIADFEQTVNTQKQSMVVSTNLSFAADNKLGPAQVNQGISSPVLIDSIDITVLYPTLTGGKSSFKLTQNASVAIVTDFDTQQGGDWGMSYVVNYKQTAGSPEVSPVSGSISSITADIYTLQVEECGILTVTFDAQQAFTSEGTKPVEIDVNFSYVTDQGVNPINQQLKLTTANQKGSITSLQAFPINKGYNYQANYVFQGGVTYPAPLVANQTGSSQIIQAADIVKSTNLIVFLKADQAANDPLLQVTVDMWYDGNVVTPPGYANTLPTKASPATFTLTPDNDSKQNLIARDVFVGLATADNPLMYSASVDSGSGEVDIDAQPIANTQGSIMINATQRYFTLEISPAAIAWASATFLSVEVLVTTTVAQGTATATTGTGTRSHPGFTWNKGESGSKYLTIPIQDGNTVSYACKLIYITPPNQSASTVSNLTDVIFNIPGTPPPSN